uniref:Nuclear autoantigenic sperm protein n=1 Tax=Gasterosteus aculeatus aculeatus TaxID=481459 RepID=G3PUQ0_GASAC
MEEANKLIGSGKKHLVMGKVVEAVSALQEACGMLAQKYGDTADECGEAFFWCGKALLDLARMENSVLGNALEGVPEDGEEDDEKPKDSNVDSTETIDEQTRDELRVQVYDAMAEKSDEAAAEVKKSDEAGAEVKKRDEAGAEVKKGDDKERGDEQQESAEKDEEKNGNCAKNEDKEAEEKSSDEEKEKRWEEDEEMEAEEQGEEDGAAEKEEEEEEEEVGNLQLAWEMLEVAKVIYKRKENKEDQLMAAQAHSKLGEVSSESGNYTQALEDFQECLKLQVKHLDADSRLLAETHYQLGLTYSLDVQYGRAIEELKSSISVIKSRLDKLQELLNKAEGPDALPDERKEMEELKALLPEIQEKVEDATEGLKMTNAAAEDGTGAADGGSTSSAFPVSVMKSADSSSSSTFAVTSTSAVGSTNGHASKAPVSDISHLVRKKRKPEESPVKEGAVKKAKQSDGESSDVHKANRDTNGHADSTEVESQ